MESPCDCGHTEDEHNQFVGCCNYFCQCKEYRPIHAIRFCLPFTPVSMNKLYEIWFSQRQVKRTAEYNTWRTRAKEHMPPWKLQSPDSLICVDAMFYYNFYCENGVLRKVDTHNMMKGLVDTIADRYGFRDERVKRCPIDSQHAKEERAVVTVSEYFINNGELEIRKEE